MKFFPYEKGWAEKSFSHGETVGGGGGGDGTKHFGSFFYAVVVPKFTGHLEQVGEVKIN